MLDPAQNHTFRDHYLEVELDLSDVVFLATANVLEAIPAPLLDRMELVRLDGYTEDEKVVIARDHLLPRQLERAGLTADEVDGRRRRRCARLAGRVHPRGRRPRAGAPARPGAAQGRRRGCLVDGGGRRPRSAPATLRELPRPAAVHRPESAERTAVPGVATGLAVTGAGGDVLFVEASLADPETGATGLHPDRPARRRHEGVGADRAVLPALARRRAGAAGRRPDATGACTSTSRPAPCPRTARARASR